MQHLHSQDVVKVRFQLVRSIKVECTLHGPFQMQCFQDWTHFLLVRKIRPFSHEKVVITQFDACRWFYAPIYRK